MIGRRLSKGCFLPMKIGILVAALCLLNSWTWLGLESPFTKAKNFNSLDEFSSDRAPRSNGFTMAF